MKILLKQTLCVGDDFTSNFNSTNGRKDLNLTYIPRKTWEFHGGELTYPVRHARCLASCPLCCRRVCSPARSRAWLQAGQLPTDALGEKSRAGWCKSWSEVTKVFLQNWRNYQPKTQTTCLSWISDHYDFVPHNYAMQDPTETWSKLRILTSTLVGW